VGATEKAAGNLNSMANHFAAAMLTNGRNRLNRAFEAVEGMPRSGGHQLERLVIFVAANFAFRHFRTSLQRFLFTDDEYVTLEA
jgi:hypothetical protein